MPSNSRVSIGRWRSYARTKSRRLRGGAGSRVEATGDLLRLAGIFHGLLHVELDVPQLAVLALDLADVDVLHDVACLRVDQHRAARALEHLALHRVEQRFSPLTLGGVERVVDHTHAVPAAHGH